MLVAKRPKQVLFNLKPPIGFFAELGAFLLEKSMKRRRCKLCGKDLTEQNIGNYCEWKCTDTYNNIFKYQSYSKIEFEDNYVIITNDNDVFKVDWEDFKKIRRYNWIKNPGGYFVSSKGTLHRFIMDAPKKMVVDHINGDKSDNRRCNLRIVTHKENQCNKINPKGGMTITKFGIRVLFERQDFYRYAMCKELDEARKAEAKFLAEYRELLRLENILA